MTIVLPEQMNARRFLAFFAELGAPLSAQEEVVLDFSRLRRTTPAILVGLTATVVRWRRQQRAVHLIGFERCAITGYLQRMDFLRMCEVDLPENFQRHDPCGRFVPVGPVDHDVGDMAQAMASCLAPGGEDYGQPLSDLHSLAFFVLTELGNNVRQHSQGQGYAAAQANRQEGMIRLALADNGRGILQSFQQAGLAWSRGITDAEAIGKALEPVVSSRGKPTNEGVGLTMVSGLVREMQGWMIILSGTGLLTIPAGGEPVTATLPNQARFQGTLLGISFRQDKVRDYAQMLERVKLARLLPSGLARVRFRP